MVWKCRTAATRFDLLRHKHQARVVFTTSIPESILVNTSTTQEQRQWAQEIVDRVNAAGADGLNMDYENPVDAKDLHKQQVISYITTEIQMQLKKRNPHSSLVWDFGWKPNVDVRFYEYERMADICDFVFLMVYDTQSQVWNGPPCLADANSPVSAVRQSLLWYGAGTNTSENGSYSNSNTSTSPSSFNIPYEKLLLGLPWYGYRYHCTEFDSQTQQCIIPTVPFRGAPCSDAAGKQMDYPFTMAALKQGKTKGIIDNITLSMKAFVHNDAGNVTAYFFDSPETIQDKIEAAWEMTDGRLGGVGVWNADVPDYSDSDQGRAFWNAMKIPPPLAATLSSNAS
ncbi:glycosyl hydrolase family 18 protein [Nitzschia inconspicua]|uniref:Glycosyl hydrolase family 18 protein n=1 Tax=Nitzschia inconspicua TaxID=303405 RepID=A0A9K3KDH8_9STRA|nr:glycosyl hydrolase family 18 protein [Nitzschia inconspicua]